MKITWRAGLPRLDHRPTGQEFSLQHRMAPSVLRFNHYPLYPPTSTLSYIFTVFFQAIVFVPGLMARWPYIPEKCRKHVVQRHWPYVCSTLQIKVMVRNLFFGKKRHLARTLLSLYQKAQLLYFCILENKFVKENASFILSRSLQSIQTNPLIDFECFTVPLYLWWYFCLLKYANQQKLNLEIGVSKKCIGTLWQIKINV